ncbi:S-adenosyl-L-methionine-dependent methyltransferase [Mollisia scopiformis]|uniref:S-adenosyl-L-methionine-dependent methyltransferase n=1 Tax=Mollisia scopiformis TaxID=149040 RepID=A0A194XJ45_MOLSC|nr:S-adenosyl-L-methionine-dependent methyltransferase [Mollisia scopiformis]KUJ20270.1 S-adenosyl-L-methionine-dependent methyltransferase [Mollisia scopiformis]
MCKELRPDTAVPALSQAQDALLKLSILARLIGAKSVLEIGTLGGYSAICFAEAGAEVTRIEINPKHQEVARESVEGLDVEVILGAALEVLPKLSEEGRQFDIVFIDADFDDQWEHFDWAVKLTRPNGCVFLDDVDSDSIITKIGKDDRVTATLVPIVATHPMIPIPHILSFVVGSE